MSEEPSVDTIVKDVCTVLGESGLSTRYDDRHDTCRVLQGGGVTITTDGDSLLINNSRDTVFLVPQPRKPTKGIDLTTGEVVVHVPSSSGTLVLSVPATGRKYLRISYEFDLNKDGAPDGGAYRTFT